MQRVPFPRFGSLVYPYHIQLTPSPPATTSSTPETGTGAKGSETGTGAKGSETGTQEKAQDKTQETGTTGGGGTNP